MTVDKISYLHYFSATYFIGIHEKISFFFILLRYTRRPTILLICVYLIQDS